MDLSHALRALAAAAFFGVPGLALAATPSPSPSALPEITHVVTSDRTDETLKNSIRTTFVVTKDDIARHGYQTVADAIAALPGIELARYGPVGSSVSYGIRGSSSAEVLVLVDGVPAPGSFGNTVSLGEMPAFGVRRIEVVEGGGSTLYGTGAIGGIINVITDAATTPQALLRYGSLGDRELKVADAGFSFERIVSTNAFTIPPANDTGVSIPATRQNADYEASSLHYGLDHALGSVQASVRAGVIASHVGVPGGLAFLSNTSRENDLNGMLNVALSHRTAHAVTTLQLSGSRQQTTFDCNAVSDANCFQPSVSVNTEARTDAGFRNTVSGGSERLMYGIDLSRGVVRNDSGGGAVPPAPSFSVDALAQSAAFVQETAQFRNGARGYAGVRAERDGSLGGELSPSVGLRVPLRDEASLALNFSTAFRAPNASELYFPGFGNPALRPERAKVGDATFELPQLFGGTTIGWFTNRTNELIVTEEIDTVKGIFAPENVDHAFLQGFTLHTQTAQLHGVRATLAVTDLYRAQDVDAAARLPHDAIFTVDLGLDIAGRDRSILNDAGISVRAVGQRDALDQTLPSFAQAAAYSTTDAFARFRLAPRVLIALRAYNIGNERYADLSGYPMPGRTFSLELTNR